MKVADILKEEQDLTGKWVIYHVGYEMDGGGIGVDHIEPEDPKHYDDFEDLYLYIADDNGIGEHDQGFVNQTKSPIWYGYRLGTPTFSDHGHHIGGEGQAWIVAKTEVPKPELNTILAKLKKGMDEDAKHAIKDGEEGERERMDYERDPYAYHGVKRSDFA